MTLRYIGFEGVFYEEEYTFWLVTKLSWILPTIVLCGGLADIFPGARADNIVPLARTFDDNTVLFVVNIIRLTCVPISVTITGAISPGIVGLITNIIQTNPSI